MLQNRPLDIDIPEEQWKELMQIDLNGIFQKLNAVKSMQIIEIYIGAGIYIYAFEEFGKLILWKNANVLSGMRRVVY